MGQSASSEPLALQRTVTNEELIALFAQQCSRALQPIELMSLKSSFNRVHKTLRSTPGADNVISETEFQTLLQFPEEHPHIRHLLYVIVCSLSQFPLLAHPQTPLTTRGLLTALTLLSKDRCNKLFTGQLDYVKLIFASMASSSSSSCSSSPSSPSQSASHSTTTQDTQRVVYQKPGVISWSDLPSVQTFDGLNFDQLSISGDDLLTLLSFLLMMTRLNPTQSLRQYTSQFSQLDQYQKHAMPILRAMNRNIISPQDSPKHTISYIQFISVVETVVPRILAPFSSVLESLLYDTGLTAAQSEDDNDNYQNDKEFQLQDEKPGEQTISEDLNDDQSLHQSRLIDPFSLAQLSTYFQPELVYSNIRKMYVGRDSGFSMRSFESKVFKWNAPSIVLLKGTRVTKITSLKNPRYKKFEEIFPKLPSSSHAASNAPTTEDTIIYGIYVDQPWKVSNKETFGSSQTVIFQLSPVQRVFKASISASHFIYFSTLGGGIGFGSQLPTIRGNNEIVRYNPGNVSLTIDSSLEFAVFRNLGLGGEFRSLGGVSDDDTYEDRFMLSDVEVWGCGGAKELEEQNKRWEWEQAEAKRRQQINLKSMGEDRALLEMAGLIGGHQSGGSV